ncbi:hypothetical protein ACWNXI_18250 [Caldibacillus thermoamylovorans]
MAQKKPFIVKLSDFLRMSRLLGGILGAMSGFVALGNGIPPALCCIISVFGFIVGRLLSIGIIFIVLSIPLSAYITESNHLSEKGSVLIFTIWGIAFIVIWLLFRQWVFVKADIVKQKLRIDDSFKLNDTPVITAPSDIIRGISGIDKFAKQLEKDPYNPLNWLLFGKVMKANKSLSIGYRLIKAPLNPVSVLTSIGIQRAIKYVEGTSRVITSEKCHLISIMLAKKRISERGVSPEDLLIIGRNYDVLSTLAYSEEDELKFIRLAIQYISAAAEKAKDAQFKAEACYYLAEIYQSLGEDELMIRFANISRKLGFIPAILLIDDYIRKYELHISEKEYIKLVQHLLDKGFIDFQYDYRPSLGRRLKDAFVSLVRGQGAKLYKSLISLDKVLNGK